MGVKRDGKGRVACFWRKGGYQEGEGMKKERGADTPLRTMTWRYYPFIHVYHKSRSYDVWFLRYKEQRTVFCHFEPFLPFDPPNNPKNQDFEKIKKTPGNIIILHLYTTNNDHMTYGSWYIKHERQNFLSSWTIFCPPNNLENQNFEKWKKHMVVLSFYTWITYVWLRRYVAWQTEFILILGHFLPFYILSPITTQRIKILK